jgi:hypothetical protein
MLIGAIIRIIVRLMRRGQNGAPGQGQQLRK